MRTFVQLILIAVIDCWVLEHETFKTEDKFDLDESNDDYENYRFPRDAGGTYDDSSDKLQIKIQNKTKPETTYDYDAVKAEFDYNLEKMEKSEESQLNATQFTAIKEKCGNGYFDVGLETLHCLLYEYQVKNVEDEKYVDEKLKEIMKFWTIVGIIIFLILWGQFGYCGCCCFCHLCHPEDVIEEVKQYVTLNPPGRQKKNDDYQNYTPTETEFYFYNKLWDNVYRDV